MSERIRPPVWQMVREATEALGSPTTNVAVRDWILERYPDTNKRTIQDQIIVCTVNHKSRIGYPQNKTPRKCESKYDLFFSADRGKLERYDPVKHGMWEIGEGNDGSVCVRIVTSDYVETASRFIEGSPMEVCLTCYERDPSARRACIDHWGLCCTVCGFDFEAVYGQLGAGYIHVHHLVLLAEIGEQYEVDAVDDLRPVCPNCHAMLHPQKTTMTIEQLRSIVEGKATS